MKKIVRLTESDISRIVRRVISEQVEKDPIKLMSQMGFRTGLTALQTQIKSQTATDVRKLEMMKKSISDYLTKMGISEENVFSAISPKSQRLLIVIKRDNQRFLLSPTFTFDVPLQGTPTQNLPYMQTFFVVEPIPLANILTQIKEGMGDKELTDLPTNLMNKGFKKVRNTDTERNKYGISKQLNYFTFLSQIKQMTDLFVKETDRGKYLIIGKSMDAVLVLKDDSKLFASKSYPMIPTPNSLAKVLSTL